ncbi:MAG: isochorismatase family protein [Spirochaetaceae bacterium]|jgi:nicotinamidase-related amidase|nr:isochorismatase family protein [Spirochaetaceae bacterium]
MDTALIIIDPQNDFCSPNGSLYVPGGEEDCRRLAAFVDKWKEKIDSVYVTLDTHPYYHIAHPGFWLDTENNHPDVYTIITEEDVRRGIWRPAAPEMSSYVEEYLLFLESKGRYRLTIWPPHCLIATWGYNVYEPLWEAVHKWEMLVLGRNIDYIMKASNPRTEHYSAIHAEVPDPADPVTRTNFSFIDKLKQYDRLIFAGEALSHCVANSVRDISFYIPASKMILLTDACSNVAGFEKLGKNFVADMTGKGMKTATTKTLILD